MTTVKIKSGDWEVEASTTQHFEYASDIRSFITAAINDAVRNYVEPKSTIKQSDLDIRDNQIMLLKEDLEVVHIYIDSLGVSRLDENNETYSPIGRFKRHLMNLQEKVSNMETEYLRQMYSEQEVEKLLEAQRGNCYVAVLNKTRDEDVALVTITTPEPGDWKKTENGIKE